MDDLNAKWLLRTVHVPLSKYHLTSLGMNGLPVERTYMLFDDGTTVIIDEVYERYRVSKVVEVADS
jgi:hypothetical protein